ncbi:tellurium resistance protein TerD [Roseimicrobium gellanilyticum]|uniref:Tellurium resistance protein TerD n=1 Tax=Roseimicrobium gellanilyticum TaxID=748857 RepID=A0A366HPT4_9BACT|nr:TerD family protein [Roseimicrobium gellanilyticum]RBP44615.1 tellurium resistance protein TerD [Roseimicrobium gellanilyticum]
MAINLSKGQRVDIGLQKIGVGLGWDPAKTGQDFDLDASAFLLGANNKIPTDEFFVFYNNMSSPDGAVTSSGDDRTGGNSDGDDETLMLDLSRVDQRIEQIIFTVTIHDYETRRQNFGQVRNSFIRIYDAVSGGEICKYELDEDFSIETAVEFGRLYKRGGAWRFEAMGTATTGGLQSFVNKYA